MASGEAQLNEMNENQEANELYITFMNITKYAAMMDKEPHNSTEIEDKDKHDINVVHSIDEDAEKAIKTNKGNEFINSLEEQSTDKSIQVNNDKEISQSDKNSPDQADGKPNNRLSKAVNELSDLEQQLSLMISGSSKQCTQQDNVSGTPCVVGKDNTSNKDTNKEEKTTTTDEDKSQDTEGIAVSSTDCTKIGVDTGVAERHATEEEKASPHASEDAAAINESNEITTGITTGPVVKETGANKNHVNEDEAKNVEINETKITTNSNGDDVKETSNETTHADGDDAKDEGAIATKASLPQTSADGVIIGEEILHDAIKSSNVLANETPPTDLLCTTSKKQGENLDQTNINVVEKSDNKVQADVKQDDGDEQSNAAMEDRSKESSPEAQDEDINSSSVPDIEILMTDESGISERKSLDSLDSLDENNHSQPDSPALSDEGIDSDSKSEVGDDDTFDISYSDVSTKSKFTSKSLEVDRNRAGSDSSTLSEQEFQRDLSDKTDSLNGEAFDRVTMQGHLLKLGGSGLTPRNWRKRWFILKGDNCLYYYKHSKDKVPCGVIVLCNYSITKAPECSRKYCFKFNKGGARSYHFCASNENEMRNWMVALMAAATEIAPDGSSFQISEGSVHNVSIPALSIKDPECHGYLSKKGHNIKNWKRRYCVLKNGYLYYYSDMSNTTALGVAKLLDYTIQLGDKRGKHYCFYGSPTDESLRTYHFAADTENDRDRWMTRMTESIYKGNTPNNVP